MQERHYETVCIINPDVGEEAAKEIVKKISGVIEKQKGVALVVSDWGRKRMTYPIAKKTSGHYVLFLTTCRLISRRKWNSPLDTTRALSATRP